MKILLWTKHPGDLLGEAIDFLTHGNAQHAAFLRADNKTIHEAYLPKVRDRLITDAEKPFVRVFELEGVVDEDDAHFSKLFDSNIQAGIKYDVADLFRYALNIPFPEQSKETICSVYVIECIRALLPAGFLPLVRCENDQVSPRDLLISPRLIENTNFQWA